MSHSVPEAEALIDPQNQNQRSRFLNSQFIRESNRKRYRLFAALLCITVISYIATGKISEYKSRSASTRYSVDEFQIKAVSTEERSEVVIAEEGENETNLYKITSELTTENGSDASSSLEESSTASTDNETDERGSAEDLSEEGSGVLENNNNETTISNSSEDNYYGTNDVANQGPLCKIPKLDPQDPSIQHIISQKVNPPKCKQKYDLIFDLSVDANSNTLLYTKKPSSLGWKNCCFRYVSRGPSSSEDPDNTEKLSKECKHIKKEKTIISGPHEGIAIYCDSIKNSTIKNKMLDAFPLTFLKPTVEKRIKTFYSKSKTDKKQSKQYNVIMLGIDAVSNLNFKRIMPKVHKYLIQNLSAISMEGFTKIGDNTYPNMLAVLTGQNTSTTNETCEKNKYYDECPFIWKKFAQKGYRTSYGEDSPWMGIFNYVRNGFKEPPTDYYLRPLTRLAENEIRGDKRGNANLCYGPRLSFKFLLNNMKSLSITMGSDRRYFQLIWATSLTHDYLNEGRLGEPLLMEFLLWMQAQDSFNKTIFMLLSDHGIRWGPIRELHQGKIEESMPFLYTIFPDSFKEKYKDAVDNFLQNKERLTTPFDVHETLADIVNLNELTSKKIQQRSRELEKLETTQKLPRGISLFLPIPFIRTCRLAEIAEHWCVCHKAKEVSVDDKYVKQGAHYAVYALNSLVAKFPQCAYLGLHSVKYAQLIQAENEKKFGKVGEKVFELGFLTTPGLGSFDATVVKNEKGQWSVSGGISRTNLYGNQSHCVEITDIKKYCYCI